MIFEEYWRGSVEDEGVKVRGPRLGRGYLDTCFLSADLR